MTHDLTPEVRRFLGRDVDSVEGLEVLLLLRRQRDRAWTVDEVVAELRSTPFAIEGRLAALLHRKLVASDGDRWRYAASAARDRTVGEVAASYEGLRLRVIEAIYGRRDPMQAFAEAFRIRETEEAGEDDDAR